MLANDISIKDEFTLSLKTNQKTSIARIHYRKTSTAHLFDLLNKDS